MLERAIHLACGTAQNGGMQIGNGESLRWCPSKSVIENAVSIVLGPSE